MDDRADQKSEMEEEKEQYRSPIARGIAAASGAVAMAILCCGDITVASLNRVFCFLDTRNNHSHNHDNNKMEGVARGVHRLNRFTSKLEAMALWILSFVSAITLWIARLVLNSGPANTLINFLPPEILRATINSFDKIWDAIEVSRKNVVSTLTGSTKDLVSKRYGEDAGKATEEGFEAIGHAIGAVTAVSGIPAAIHPRNAIAPTSLAKVANTSSSTTINKKET